MNKLLETDAGMQDRPPIGMSLLFLHIPKTGGNSVVDMLSQLYSADQVISDSGNLSPGYITQHPAWRRDPFFAHGHVSHGVSPHLIAPSRTITWLRRPADQIVSNFMHILRDSSNDLHSSANELGLSAFIRTHWNHAIFQLGSLAVALTEAPLGTQRALESVVGRVFVFLNDMLFVGVLERQEESCQALAGLLGSKSPLDMRTLNAAASQGADSQLKLRLLEEFQELRCSAEIAHLIALEEALYQKANTLLDARLEALGLPDKSGTSAGRAHRKPCGEIFIAADRFFSTFGKCVERSLVCLLPGGNQCAVYGPYRQLEAGDYTIEFQFAFEGTWNSRENFVQIEVVANGTKYLASRHMIGRRRIEQVLSTLSFNIEDPKDVLEFRIGVEGFAGAQLRFDGVTIKRADPSAAIGPAEIDTSSAT